MAEPLTTRFEADLAAALNAYAEAAPTAVDAAAVAHAVAAARPRARARSGLEGWRLLRPALLLAALLALLIAMLLVTGSWPRPGGVAWVAYQRPTFERNNAHAVHLIRSDGTGDVFAGAKVPGGEQLHPDWSPDGRRIALDALDLDDTDGTYDIWIVDTSDLSAEPEKVVDCSAPCLYAQEPAWSPDGGRIAFQRHTMTEAGEISTIEILDLESGEITTVLETPPTKGVFAPRWSPDGASLVFEQVLLDGETFLGVSLEILDLATPGTTRQLIPVETMANNSDWSADGSLILFSAPAEGGEPGGALSDIWVVAPDGSGLRPVTDVASRGGTAIKATFSPDGSRIVFLLTDPTLDASDAMASIAIDGTDLRPLVGDDWTFGYHARMQP
jgi:Tol biopolymer transport system component